MSHATGLQPLPPQAALSGTMFWPLLTLLPGAVHSTSMVAMGHPFDTVKTRLQLKMHTSMVRCVLEAAKTDGLLSLYRGATMPLLQLACKRPFEFAAFEWFNARYRGRPGSSFGGGCLAGVVAAVLGCPFSVVKIQMQSRGREVHANSFQAVANVWRKAGAIAFYRGLKASVITKVPFSTLYLGMYGELRQAIPRTSWSPALAGGVASIVTWTLLQPLDTICTQIQSTVLRENAVARTWTGQVKHVVQTRGVLGLWAGWGPVALRALPTSAVAMLAYEWARSWVDRAVS
mmetsp:Transcript_44551/g.123398  ORF Transcript_44551/g.123398 Transcript_44551/m.123398 type:complete len:289 (+) Transcript_44551:87-953(+)